jgi:hypothetical protein
VLKRVPWLGAAIGAAGLYSAATTPDDPSATPDENRDKKSGAVGSVAGGLAGGAAGAATGAALGAVLGPPGALVGAIAGSIAGAMGGEVVGEQLGMAVGKGLEKAGVQDKAAAVGEFASTTAKDAAAKLSSMAETGRKALADIAKPVKEFAGDVADKAIAAKDAAVAAIPQPVKDIAAEVAEKAVAAKDAAVAAIPDPVKKVAASVANKATAVNDWVLGQTSKIFESGRGGAGTVSTGKGDHGGASYGTYQLSSTKGIVQKFLKSNPEYGSQFTGLTPGTPEFDARWKEVAAKDKGFESKQHDFIKATDFDPAMAGLKNAGIDLSGRGAAVSDSIWSTSVQFGAGSAAKGNGAIGMTQKALAGKDVAKLSDAQIVSAIQDYKIANNDRLFASSSAKTRESTANRAVKEKERLIALSERPASQAAAAQPAEKAPATSQKAPAATPTAANQPPADASTEAATSANAATATSAGPAVLQVSPTALPRMSAVSAGTIKAPVISPVWVMPPIPEQPKVEAPPPPLNSDSDDRSFVQQRTPVSQDLPDRQLAHIVTGGLGSQTR